MGWSILRFAKEAGMRESTIRHLDHHDWSPTADTLRKLESVIPTDWRLNGEVNAGVRAAPDAGA